MESHLYNPRAGPEGAAGLSPSSLAGKGPLGLAEGEEDDASKLPIDTGLRGMSSLEPPNKRPRLERDASMDAPSTLSDVTTLSLQRLKHLLLSPTTVTDPHARHAWMENLNAAIQQAQQEGVKTPEAQAILANLVSIASVKSNESVQSLADEPNFNPLVRRPTSVQQTAPLLPGSFSRVGKSEGMMLGKPGSVLDRSSQFEIRPWSSSLSGSRSIPISRPDDRPKSSFPESFSIPMPGGSALNRASSTSRPEPSSGRPEKFRVYSNAFHQDASQGTQKPPAPPSSTEPQTRSKSKVEAGRSNQQVRSWGKDSWIQKPNKVSVITRSQLNKTTLPKAASAGPAVCRELEALPAAGPRQASAPDLPPASSTSMGRIMPTSTFRKPSDNLLPIHERPLVGCRGQEKEEPSLHRDKAIKPDRLGSLERHPASENFGKGLSGEQDLSRLQASMDAQAAVSKPFGSLPDGAEQFGTQAMMDQLAWQWLHQRMSAQRSEQQMQMNNLPRTPFNENQMPLDMLFRPIAVQQIQGSQEGEHGGRADAAPPSPWADTQHKVYRPMPGASALPSIMALSSFHARQRTARDAPSTPPGFRGEQAAGGREGGLLSELSTCPRVNFSKPETSVSFQPIQMPTAHKQQDLEMLARQFQESRLQAIQQQLPPAFLQQQGMTPINPGLQMPMFGMPPSLAMAGLESQREVLRKAEAEYAKQTTPSNPQRPIPQILHQAIPAAFRPGDEDELDVNNPFAVQRDKGESEAPQHRKASTGSRTEAVQTEAGVSSHNKQSSSDTHDKPSSDEEEQAAEILLSLIGTPKSASVEVNKGSARASQARRPRTQRGRGRRLIDNNEALVDRKQ